jgi:hypothetical protein
MGSLRGSLVVGFLWTAVVAWPGGVAADSKPRAPRVKEELIAGASAPKPGGRAEAKPASAAETKAEAKSEAKSEGKFEMKSEAAATPAPGAQGEAAATVRGQPTPAAEAKEPALFPADFLSMPRASDAPVMERLRLEPSLYDTGRVGKINVAGGQMRPSGAHPDSREIEGERKAQTIERPPAYPGRVNRDALDRDLRSRFALLRLCRSDVARARRIALDAVTASQLTLRWTILPSGRVTDTLVVATAPVDGKVMDCVKRQMSLWTFASPEGGAARVERPFQF